MNAQEQVSEPTNMMHDSNLCEQGQEDDDSRVDSPVENQATDQEDSIIDETLDLSTVKDSTRSKSNRYVIPTSISPPYSENLRTSNLNHHAVRGLNEEQAFHAQVSTLNFSAETRTNLQVPPARSLQPEGDGLAAASLNDSIRPTAGVEFYTAAAVVVFSIEPTIFQSVDAAVRRDRRAPKGSTREPTTSKLQ
jgi:hypothetical protein